MPPLEGHVLVIYPPQDLNTLFLGPKRGILGGLGPFVHFWGAHFGPFLDHCLVVHHSTISWCAMDASPDHKHRVNLVCMVWTCHPRGTLSRGAKYPLRRGPKGGPGAKNSGVGLQCFGVIIGQNIVTNDSYGYKHLDP